MDAADATIAHNANKANTRIIFNGDEKERRKGEENGRFFPLIFPLGVLTLRSRPF